MTAWASWAEAMEWLGDFAADHPLEALRDYGDYLDPYQLDAAAIAEPAAALIYTFDRLSAARRAACEADPRARDLRRFYPDRDTPSSVAR